MKNQLFIFPIIAGTVLFTFISLIAPQETFYYAFDEKVPLISKSNVLLVKYEKGTDKSIAETYLKKSFSGIEIKWHNPILAEITLSSEQAKSKLFKTIQEHKQFSTHYLFRFLVKIADFFC